ncbi:hypothetical protein [[Eubacterium] cellulosolvens]
MYTVPVAFICPIGPYPNCVACRHFYQCPYFVFPPGSTFATSIFMPPAPYPRDRFCQRCGHALVWNGDAGRWYCGRCQTYH